MSRYFDDVADIAKARAEGKPYTPAPHNPNELMVMRFKGTPEKVYDDFHDWVERKQKQYPDTFKVENMTTIPMPSGAFMIVTWKGQEKQQRTIVTAKGCRQFF